MICWRTCRKVWNVRFEWLVKRQDLLKGIACKTYRSQDLANKKVVWEHIWIKKNCKECNEICYINVKVVSCLSAR